MKAVKNNRGSAMPFFVVILFFILALVAIIYQNGTMITTGYSVRNAMQKVALNAVTQNSAATYPSKREGYSGAYQKVGSWQPAVEAIDPATQLTVMLQLTGEGEDLVRRGSGGEELYRLINVQINTENTAWQDRTDGIKATVQLDLVITVKYPLVGEKKLTIPISVGAENKMKF